MHCTYSLRFLALAILTLQAACNAAAPAQTEGDRAAQLVSSTTADQQDELQNLFDEAAKTGKSVKLPPGIFLHSGMLIIDGIEVSGSNDQTILKGMTRDRSAIVMRGDGVKLSNLKITYPAKTRSLYDEAAGILIDRAKNFTIEKVTIDGSECAGILSNGAGPGVITGNILLNTLADSIHMTKMSHDITVKDNITHNSGDDGIAVVSYLKDGGVGYNIKILHNTVLDNKFARGITVIGGKNVEIADNFIRCKAGYTGIMMASESSFQTYGTSNIRVQGNVVQNCGGEKTGQGGIMVSRDNRDNQNIAIIGNTVIDAKADGIIVEGNGNKNVSIKKNIVLRPRWDGIKKRGSDDALDISGNSVVEAGQ